MSRPFRFKRFTIVQENSAMKVGTDGVLLGAWCTVSESDRRALDIGTGTGVIALMLAQRGESNPLVVEAIEIDEQGALEAQFNVGNSPWPDRVEVLNVSLQDYEAEKTAGFDLIVSNPPFFADSLHTPNPARTLARHSVSLSYDELVSCSSSLLNSNGRLCVVIPYDREDEFILLSDSFGLKLSRLTRVFSKPGIPPIRSLVEVAHIVHDEPLADNLVIEVSGPMDYSEQYRALTRDFYLKF